MVLLKNGMTNVILTLVAGERLLYKLNYTPDKTKATKVFKGRRNRKQNETAGKWKAETKKFLKDFLKLHKG